MFWACIGVAEFEFGDLVRVGNLSFLFDVIAVFGVGLFDRGEGNYLVIVFEESDQQATFDFLWKVLRRNLATIKKELVNFLELILVKVGG